MSAEIASASAFSYRSGRSHGRIRAPTNTKRYTLFIGLKEHNAHLVPPNQHAVNTADIARDTGYSARYEVGRPRASTTLLLLVAVVVVVATTTTTYAYDTTTTRRHDDDRPVRPYPSVPYRYLT